MIYKIIYFKFNFKYNYVNQQTFFKLSLNQREDTSIKYF